ncbi:MAG: hypothetical protein ACREIF_03525 [Chthoniobacterales bacterium]
MTVRLVGCFLFCLIAGFSVLSETILPVLAFASTSVTLLLPDLTMSNDQTSV